MADARTEILKAELAALLHDLGKLNNTFITHSASDAPAGSKFHVERVVPPKQAIIIVQAAPMIETLAPFDLTMKLLSDLDWGEHATTASAIGAALRRKATAGSPPTSAASMRRWLFAVVKEISDVESALPILCPLYGACKLHEVLLETPSSAHRHPYEGLTSDGIQFLLDMQVKIKSEYSLGEIITLMWDEFHVDHRRPTSTGDPTTDEYNRVYNEYNRQDALSKWLGKPTFLPRYLITSHGSTSGIKVRDAKKQPKDKMFSASAYGYEGSQVPNLDIRCSELLRDLVPLTSQLETSTKWQDTTVAYQQLTWLLRQHLQQGLGDTRRPDNDTTLQDYSASIAALYKASLAQAVLADDFCETHELRWRLLYVSYDGLDFWGQAHHVTDLLGRRQVLQQGLNAAQEIIEVQYPLGNEVYRDEHGSVFVVPGIDNLEGLKDEHDQTLEKLLKQAFDGGGLRGELMPQIQVSGPFEGKKINLGQALEIRRYKNVPQTDAVEDWWAEEQRPKNAEICTVCGLRPVGHGTPDRENHNAEHHDAAREPIVGCHTCKTLRRKICYTCYLRRGRRAKEWATDGLDATIWMDEVADDNGRFALIVGRFDLNGWLDGKLIPTMLKFASFARIRRCWDTTQQFWRDLVEEHRGEQPELKKEIQSRSFRLRINPAEIKGSLGAYHVYDWPLQGGVTLSVVWDKERGCFISADNLDYLAGPTQLNFPKEVRQDQSRLLCEFGQVINGQREIALQEPSGYGQPSKVKAKVRLSSENAVNRCSDWAYTPYIPILAEPATFMALVPADRAMRVVASIKKKYDTEMGRVRDRLPIHLGLVFAPRRTPLRSVLEAGRAMLEMPAEWEEWQIQATGRKASFSQNGQRLEWKYPETMGDNNTPDIWYPHVLQVNPSEKADLDINAGDFCLVENASGAVYIRPSRFDFEFLDTTGRRFEISYQTSEVSETSEVYRPSRRARPFYLDDLERLEGLWTTFCHLKKSQRNQIVASIEATRELWFGRDLEGKSTTDSVFKTFVRDTLAGAAWPSKPKWNTPPEKEALIAAGVSGQLTDLFELHSQILKE